MRLSNLLGKNIPQYSVFPDFKRPHHQTSVGIEVEVENISRRDHRLLGLKRWKVADDPSVPDGIELISDPVWGSAISDALSELRVLFSNTSPMFSPKTSTHIHLNVLDMESKDLKNLLLISNLMYNQ